MSKEIEGKPFWELQERNREIMRQVKKDLEMWERFEEEKREERKEIEKKRKNFKNFFFNIFERFRKNKP